MGEQVIEVMMVKNEYGQFIPATDYDRDLIAAIKVGQATKHKITSKSVRSIEQHRFYFAGILGLAFDYWEPKGGLISSAEKEVLKNFAGWLDHKSGNSGAIYRAARQYLVEMKGIRGAKIEVPKKNKEALHRWIKQEAGLYQLELSPAGIRKEVSSISMGDMKQEQFNKYVDDAFNVVWNLVLSSKFENEEQAKNAINQLLAIS